MAKLTRDTVARRILASINNPTDEDRRTAERLSRCLSPQEQEDWWTHCNRHPHYGRLTAAREKHLIRRLLDSGLAEDWGSGELAFPPMPFGRYLMPTNWWFDISRWSARVMLSAEESDEFCILQSELWNCAWTVFRDGLSGIDRRMERLNQLLLKVWSDGGPLRAEDLKHPKARLFDVGDTELAHMRLRLVELSERKNGRFPPLSRNEERLLAFLRAGLKAWDSASNKDTGIEQQFGSGEHHRDKQQCPSDETLK